MRLRELVETPTDETERSGAFLLHCPRACSRIYVEPTHLSRRAVRIPFAIMVPELNSQNATRYTVVVAERPKRSRGGCDGAISSPPAP